MKYPTQLSGATAKIAVAALTLCGIVTVKADTSFFAPPGFRGQPGTESAYWETFTVAYLGANSPDGVAHGGSALANASIAQILTPTAFLTGGNIYSPAAATGLVLSYSGGSDLNQVVFQSRTLGTEMNYAGLALTYDIGSGPVNLSATRVPLADGAGGASSSWTWDLSGLGVNSFTIGFSSPGPHMSFDAAMLDVAAVPEPGTAALFGLGTIAFLGRRFARRSISC